MTHYQPWEIADGSPYKALNLKNQWALGKAN